MPRKKRAPSPFELYDDDYDEDVSSQSSRNGQPPVQRNAANARERMRMRVLSSAYGRLKTKLPNIPPDTKLSKLDTLRLATLYIKQLIAAVEHGTDNVSGDSVMDTPQLGEHDFAGMMAATPFGFHQPGAAAGMSWPFEFSQHNNLRQQYPTQMRMDWTTHTPHNNEHHGYVKQQQMCTRQEQHSSSGGYSSMSDQEANWYSGAAVTATPGMRCTNNENHGNNCIFETLNIQNENQQQQQQSIQQQQQQMQNQQRHKMY